MNLNPSLSGLLPAQIWVKHVPVKYVIYWVQGHCDGYWQQCVYGHHHNIRAGAIIVPAAWLLYRLRTAQKSLGILTGELIIGVKTGLPRGPDWNWIVLDARSERPAHDTRFDTMIRDFVRFMITRLIIYWYFTKDGAIAVAIPTFTKLINLKSEN